MTWLEATIEHILEKHRVRVVQHAAGGSLSAVTCTCGSMLVWLPADADTVEKRWRCHVAQEMRSHFWDLLCSREADAMTPPSATEPV